MALTISRILHAGYVFDCEDTRIAFDPIFENPFSKNCHAFPDVRFDTRLIREQSFDAVFISHFHDDHCSMDSLDLLKRDTPIYLYCLYDELFAMIRQLGFSKVQALAINVPVTVGPITVMPRLALDPEVDSMFHVQAAGLNVLNVVDSWMDPAALAALAPFAPWDMVLWPFQTMRELAVLAPSRAEPAAASLPTEWIEQLQALNPRYVVPSSCQFNQESWSWYNQVMFPITYRQFEQEVGAALPAATVVKLNPSVSVVLSQQGLAPAAPLAWVCPVGPQDLDFQFDASATAPPSADIARRFGALTPEQAAAVLAYCRTGLPDRFEQMEADDGGYFDQARTWRLRLLDHQGAATVFDYRVHGTRIELLQTRDGQPDWLTEIAMTKLHGALTEGESLSSIYIRINDAVFDAATEAKLASADILDDPLVRCLYNDAFGAYQAAQLRRLSSPAA